MKTITRSMLALFFALLLCFGQTYALASHETLTGEGGVTELYGYRSSSTAGEGNSDWVMFSAQEPGTVTSLCEFDGYATAAEYYDGVIYGYNFNGEFFTADADTLEPVFNGTTSGGYSVIDLSYDYSTDTMYALANHRLLTVDMQTGALTDLGQFSNAPNVIIMIAITTDGQMYGVCMGSSNIYQINPQTRVATEYMDMGITASAYIQSMTYDHESDLIYWARFNADDDSMLHCIDLEASTVTQMGLIGAQGSCIAAMFMKYEHGGGELLPGDANGDGTVNVGDAATVLRYVVGLISGDGDIVLQVCDVNEDGVVNTGDAAAILSMIISN